MRVREGEVYGGGTAMGSVQVYGAQQREKECPIPDEVHGVSVGTITAAMRSAGKLRRLRQIWLNEVMGARFFQKPNPAIWNGLFTLEPLRRTVLEELHPDDLRCPTYAHCVDLGTKRYNRILLNDCTHEAMADAMLASCAQFGIHTAVEYEGRKKGDGGLKHVLPALVRPWERLDRLWAFACSPVSHPSKDNKIGQDEITVGRSAEILVDTIEEQDFERLQVAAEHGVETWLVQPQERPGDPFDATPTTNKRRLRKVGRRAWEGRERVQPRPGLHLSEAEYNALIAQCARRGWDLAGVLAQVR